MELINLPDEILCIIYSFIECTKAGLFSRSNKRIKTLFNNLDKNTKFIEIKSFIDISILKKHIINNCRLIKIANSIQKIVNVRNAWFDVFTIICYGGFIIEIYFTPKLDLTQITVRDNDNEPYIIEKFEIITFSEFNYKCKPLSSLTEKCLYILP
tara:strand:- start:58 stop:522 length:465 start_codon:yes stop_codon:yes gene_type:complete